MNAGMVTSRYDCHKGTSQGTSSTTSNPESRSIEDMGTLSPVLKASQPQADCMDQCMVS